ncbi:neuronal acetylcholine receptor subunit alpha-9-like [Anneissia japonica]|uniref:neuronal acetylcholine receptor subunit alpha-9-like n=1 Tax=Anneissia japonica TaxID=1529436 RepID=UPI001425919F|nr:neuronal acetylcholine receptor subunit alpha-9-like [Anneissia japonica]
MRTEWKDELIPWNASEYGDINEVFMQAGTLWQPDITLYNNVDSDFERYKEGLYLKILSDGTVTKAAPAILTSFCRMDVQYFPFDEQHCNLKFGSWLYHGWQLDINFPGGSHNEQTEFDENGVWELSSVLGEKQVSIYNCCPEPYPTLDYTLILKRRPEFFMGNILIPCVLLSFVTMLVFYLPPECDEKISFAITNLLAIILFQQLIAETLPPSADNSPLLSRYFTILVSMGCISILFTAFVLNVYNKNGGVRAPRWLRVLMLRKVARIVFYTPRAASTRSCESDGKNKESYMYENGMCTKVDVVRSAVNQNNKKLEVPGNCNGHVLRETNFFEGSDKPDNNPQASHTCRIVNKELEDILKELKGITKRMKDDEEETIILMEWKDIGAILDRIFLLMALTVAIIATLVIIVIRLTINGHKSP